MDNARRNHSYLSSIAVVLSHWKLNEYYNGDKAKLNAKYITGVVKCRMGTEN